LTRYLSPPLFPVRLRDVAARLELHDVPLGPFAIGEMEVRGEVVIHPGQTIGYRISDGQSTVAYLPDHEPALGWNGLPTSSEWTSGHDLAADADILIHDAQYTAEEYESRIGWGHSRVGDAVQVARMAGAKRLITFHHDPAHDDGELDEMVEDGRALADGALEVIPGREGATLHA
jgi:phosphoribosyl 1,2-cyclic phosphodiesterase